MKKFDAFISKNLANAIDELNNIGVTKEEIVTIFQNNYGQYIVIFVHDGREEKH